MIFDNRNEMEVVTKICQRSCRSYIPVCQRHDFLSNGLDYWESCDENTRGVFMPEKRLPATDLDHF